jgi:hypothetical protein
VVHSDLGAALGEPSLVVDRPSRRPCAEQVARLWPLQLDGRTPPGHSSTRSGAPGSSMPSAFMRAMMRATNERSASVRAGIHKPFEIGSAASGSALSRQATYCCKARSA